MRYPYNTDYSPPFPSGRIAVRNDALELSSEQLDGLIDTGADATMIPVPVLEQVHARPLMEKRVRSHWGEWRQIEIFLVDLEFDGPRLPNIHVIGDEVGSEVILGRDVLNKLRILLDGPNKETQIR